MRFQEQKIEGILISSPENIFYLSGIDNVEGLYFLDKDGAKIFTDFRYTDAVMESAPPCEIIQIDNLTNDFTAWLSKKGFKKIGFESLHTSVETYNKLKGSLSHTELVPCLDFVEDLRLIKDEQEQAIIIENAKILGSVVDKVPEIIKKNHQITEKELATEIDYLLKKAGAKGAAFDIIVSTGKRSAFPHSVPKEYKINTENILLVDCGGMYKGYSSDITRVMATNSHVPKRINEIYEIVREAQRTAIEMIKPGVYAKQIDLAAREVIKKAGFGENFRHATGHGVGILVHEEPKINYKSETKIMEGMVFTIEPGIYLRNEFGIRWEDMMLVKNNSCEIISKINWDNIQPV